MSTSVFLMLSGGSNKMVKQITDDFESLRNGLDVEYGVDTGASVSLSAMSARECLRVSVFFMESGLILAWPSPDC
jgi:hypothetical protein